MNPEVNQVAHETLVILAVVNYLLAQEHVLTRTNKLALLLAPARKGPPGIEEMQNGSFPSICFILGLMDNCSQAFPKIAHHAACSHCSSAPIQRQPFPVWMARALSILFSST